MGESLEKGISIFLGKFLPSYDLVFPMKFPYSIRHQMAPKFGEQVDLYGFIDKFFNGNNSKSSAL
jgi:hypothetical protein